MSNLNDEFCFKIDDGKQIRLFKIGKDDSQEELTGWADSGVSITEVEPPESTETDEDAHDIFFVLPDPARLDTTSEGDDTSTDSDNDEDGGNDRNDIDCFLTSACLLARGLPDTCEELTILRHFRDTNMSTTAHNRALIDEYYNIAPGMVKKINTLPNAKVIWLLIYEGLVVPTVSLINNSKFEEAIEHYRSFTVRLAAAISKH